MLKDKSVLNSFTFWGGLLVAAATFAEAQGLLTEGAAKSFGDLAISVGGFLALMGVRRAL
jgi:hypothetical protein